MIIIKSVSGKIKKFIENEKFKIRLKFLALFLLGFLLGLMFKSQALKSIVVGYDDYKIFQNKETDNN
jgi:hypothetical protein